MTITGETNLKDSTTAQQRQQSSSNRQFSKYSSIIVHANKNKNDSKPINIDSQEYGQQGESNTNRSSGSQIHLRSNQILQEHIDTVESDQR